MSQAAIIENVQGKRKLAPVVFGIVLVGVVGLIFLLLYGLQLRAAPPLASGRAPEFSLTSFDGQLYSSSNLQGRVVIVNFWASWCIPCRDEAPALQRAWDKYRDKGLVILGVDYVDTEPEAKTFITQFNQTYPNGPDVGTRISQAYHISGVPETYFIGKDGKLLSGIDSEGHVNANWIGPITEDALNARIERLLSE